MKLRMLIVFGIACLPALGACRAPKAEPLSGMARPLSTPARAGSGEPCLAVAPDGAVFMSWLEKLGGTRHALKVAQLEGERWSRPVVVAQGDSFFVNWADFPILLALDAQRLVVAWPWKHEGGDVYAYDLRMAFSGNAGRTWSRPTMPHHDNTPTEHGFVSLAREGNGVRVVWLDGRMAYIMEKLHGADSAKAKGEADDHGHGDMSLHTAWVGLDGSLAHEGQLDARVCDCCQTAAAAIPGGVVVAYRDRSADEVRDISFMRIAGGSSWGEPKPLHRDGWKIDGCPVNGPALDAVGDRIAAAWFTAAEDTSKVLAAFSSDGGRTFGAPLRVDGGDPLGRADVALLEDGSALVIWLENVGDGRAGVQARRVGPVGKMAAPLTLARTGGARASGFPRLVRQRDRVVVAWTETGKTSQVKVAFLPLEPELLDSPLPGARRR